MYEDLKRRSDSPERIVKSMMNACYVRGKVMAVMQVVVE